MTTEEGIKLCKRAIVLDIACIVLALLLLFLTYKGIVPLWAQIATAVVTAGLLAASIYYYVKGRRAQVHDEIEGLDELLDTGKLEEKP